jgi:hypothetical protein
MAYLPLSAIAAMSLEEYIRGRQHWKKWQALLIILPGMLIGLAMLALPIIGMNVSSLLPYLKDPFAAANLEATVSWSYFDLIPGVLWMVGLLGGVIYLSAGTHRTAIVFFFGGTLLSTSVFLCSFPQRIAGYTQQAAVDFYTSKQGEDVYVETLRFKSYAQYFYFRKAGFSSAERAHCTDSSGNYHIDALREWYLHGDIDKPVYFVVKNIHADEFLAMPGMEFLSEKNGFVFIKRDVPKAGVLPPSSDQEILNELE